MYKVNDKVTIVKTGEVKQIIDFETVCGVEVYYMSDRTAHPVDELYEFKNLKSKEELNKKLLDNKERIVNLINYEKVSKNWSDWFLKKFNDN